MSKIRLISFVVSCLIYYLLMPSSVTAVSCDIVETNPKPIYTESDSATFKIDVGNNNEPGITSWKMEFQCGGRYQQVDSSKNSDSKTISSTIQRSRIPGQGCEFHEGPHTIAVKAINTAGKWIDWCTVSYDVLNPDRFCKLSINPTTGLTPSTTITVSGENLTAGGQFRLFISNDKGEENRIDPGFYVDTPTFSGITIPAEYLSPTKHSIYLKRRYQVQVNLPVVDRYGPPLCPLEFTIGPASSPGSVTGGTAGGSSGTKGPPTLAEGKQCGSDKDPAIQTAIGCIHTSPVGFVKDFFRFILGIAGGLAFLMMLLGAFQMLTSAGNPETLAAGRERLTSAVIGLLFVIFSVLLLQIIGVDILFKGLPGFGR